MNNFLNILKILIKKNYLKNIVKYLNEDQNLMFLKEIF